MSGNSASHTPLFSSLGRVCVAAQADNSPCLMLQGSLSLPWAFLFVLLVRLPAMTYAYLGTVRERRDQRIYNSTLLLGKASFYSLHFLNLESSFVLRLPIIGKGLSVRTSSQKWHSWTVRSSSPGCLGKCHHRFMSGTHPANDHNGYNRSIHIHCHLWAFMETASSWWPPWFKRPFLGKEHQSRGAVTCPSS